MLVKALKSPKEPPTKVETDPNVLAEPFEPKDEEANILFGRVLLGNWGFKLSPVDGALSTQRGVMVGLDAFAVTGDKHAGLALDLGLMAGFGGQKSRFFDSYFGLGAGFQLGPLGLAPTVGVGVDGLSPRSDDPLRFHTPFALYGYASGRLSLDLGELLSLDVRAQFLSRRNQVDERRFYGGFNYQKKGSETGFAFQAFVFDYVEQAKMIGLGIAVSSR